MNNRRRRELLHWAAAFGAAGASGLIREVLAAGDLPPGLHRLDGTVAINGKPAQAGAKVNLGDRVVTGPKSSAVVVLKGDALLMRADTVIEVKGESGLLTDMLVASGRVLSVFSKKPVNIKAATATIGIRGTGAYIEVDPGSVYFCLCYGEALVDGPQMQTKTVKTTHHEQPLLLTERGGILAAEPGPFRNHTDDELIMLESLVGREPPFMKDGKYPANKY
jgi:hypothetical protein